MDERSITYNPETKKTTVKRMIDEEFTEESIVKIYDEAVKEKADYEKAIKRAKDVKFALNRLNTEARLKDIIETLELLFDLKVKFTIEQLSEMEKYYLPMLENVTKKIEELSDIYNKIKAQGEKSKSQS